MHLAHRLLLAYDSRIRGLDSHVRELTEHLDSTREIWHMQLDAMRNRIIHLGLHLEFVGVSTMLATLPAGAHPPPPQCAGRCFAHRAPCCASSTCSRPVFTLVTLVMRHQGLCILWGG